MKINFQSFSLGIIVTISLAFVTGFQSLQTVGLTPWTFGQAIIVYGT